MTENEIVNNIRDKIAEEVTNEIETSMAALGKDAKFRFFED